jgi:predicted PurR-regulated permease PerM
LNDIEPSADRQKWWWFAVGALFLVLLYYLAPVLTPFVLAAVLAYICLPLVEVMSPRVPRSFAAVLVITLVGAIFLVLLVVVLPLFVREAIRLSQGLPDWLERLNDTVAPWLNQRLGTDIHLDPESIRTAITEAVRGNEDLSTKLLVTARMGGLGLLGFAANIVLVPVVMFFLLRDWHPFIARFEQLIPRGWYQDVVGFFREADHALGQYLHGQVIVLAVMSVYYILALWATGLDFFLPIGVVTGLLTFIPFVGATVGFLLATVSALMQFDDSTRLLWVWGVFILGQVVEGNFITPRLVGNAIGLHPLAVIFALLAFGQLFGFTGMLIALPASAVLLVGLRKLRRRYIGSPFYNQPPE